MPLGHVAAGMYEAPKPLTKDDPIQMSDIHDFFIDYMKNDILGIIANTHVSTGGEGNEINGKGVTELGGPQALFQSTKPKPLTKEDLRC